MGINLKKGGFSKVIVFLVLVVICAAMLPFTAMGDINQNSNVSSKVNIGHINVTYYENGQWNTYMTGGAVTEPDKIFQKGTTIKFFVKWSVSNANIKDINEGDYFYVDIPSSYFTFSEVGPVKVEDSKGRLIGEYSVSNQVMKFVFSETVDDPTVTEIKDGWLMAKGSLSVSSIPNNTVSMGGVSIPTTATKPAVEPGDEPTNPYPFNPPERPDPDILEKGKWMNNDNQTIYWYLAANHDMYQAKYNGLSSYDIRRNAIIEDKLEDYQQFKDIQFYHKYYYSTQKGTMSSESFDVYYNTSETFTLVEDNQNEDYDTFKARVISTGQDGNKPAYGIWQKRNVVISLGDIPGKLDMPLTRGELITKLSTNTYNGDRIPNSIQEKTLAAYDKFFGSANADATAPAYSLNLRISASIAGKDRTVSNTAYMYWNDEEQTSSTAEVLFESIAGGAELGVPGSVTIRKYDSETADILDGIEFMLQKQEGGSNNFVDYTAPDQPKVKTTSGGSVVFTGLDYGTYRVVEVAPLAGYQDKTTFKDGDGTFTIEGGEAGTIYIDAYNYKDEVKDSETTPPAVLGDEETPLSDKEGTVLGEESRTADLSNLTSLLIVLLITMIILLIASIQYTYGKR